jgi:flagellar M-ring protein FliF
VNAFLATIRALGVVRMAMMAGIAAALLGFFAFLLIRAGQPPMSLLYGNLDLQESGQIVNKLEGMKVPYRLAGGGSQIMVPEDQVARLRLNMAESGLPTGGSVGYELFDRSEALGSSSFVQNINQNRALEGELARTIRGINGVAGARVHLVMPKREVFSRDTREPSASIVLKIVGRLDPQQTRAIRNLVAAAVPDLKPSRISIVDDRGNLLAGGFEDNDNRAGAGAFGDLRQAQEERLRKAVETLLERTVGPGNVRAEVTAEMDFDRVTTNSEQFDPDGQVVRSTQTVSERNTSAEGSSSVSVANNLPSAAQNQGGGSQNQSNNQRSEETVNYEVSKTIRTQVKEAGTVRRLSVAVVVNGGWATDAEGKRTFTPRTEDELKQFTALVRSAVGYDEKRGDRVEVLGTRFVEMDPLVDTGGSEGGLFDFSRRELMALGQNVAFGLIALLGLLFVARPLLKRLNVIKDSAPPLALPGMSPPALQATALPGQSIPGGRGLAQLTADGPEGHAALPAPGGGLEQMIDIARIEGQVKASSLKKIGEIVEAHPEEAVGIMRNWLLQPA